MKYLKFFIVITLFCTCISFVYYKNLYSKNIVPILPLISPVVTESDMNSLAKYNQTLLAENEFDANWKPGELFGTANEPEIAGHAALLIDLNTNKVVFEKNSTEKLKIASLTKIMTAVVALEHHKLEDRLYVDPDSSTIGENAMGISSGEVYTVDELMYGLVLQSGNDAAYALAKGSAGTVSRFVDWMNIKAQELGLTDTHFTDPSGLDDDTYSTAQDLVKLTRYALTYPEFKKVVATVTKELAANDDHKYFLLENQTNLLTSYPGVAGVKTGYTEEAGLCLVTYAKNDGREVLGVVLNSVDRKGDMVLMLDHGFSTLGVAVSHPMLTF